MSVSYTHLSDMISTAWNGLDNTHFRLGDNVAVFGIGPVGLCAIAGVRRKGAGRIFAIGTNPKGIELALEFGATDIISYKEGDVVAQIRKKNGGPVDVSVLAGGNGSTVSQAYRLTRPGGQICSVNAFYDDVVKMCIRDSHHVVHILPAFPVYLSLYSQMRRTVPALPAG